jgi:hypothetical protein
MRIENIDKIYKKIDDYIDGFEMDIYNLVYDYQYKCNICRTIYLDNYDKYKIVSKLNLEQMKKHIHKIISFNQLSKSDKERFLYINQIYSYEEYNDMIEEYLPEKLSDLIEFDINLNE